MQIKDALDRAGEKLNDSDSARLDAELLLALVLKKGREFFYAHPEQELTAGQEKKFQALVGRRSKGEPVAYIVNKKEFFGRDFYVDKNVLIPRPETEVLVEEALEQVPLLQSSLAAIIDVGTGSGCVAVSLSKNLPAASKAKIYALDASAQALAVARRNARRHGVSSKIKFLKGNLLEPLTNDQCPACLAGRRTPNAPMIITANLPYIPAKQYACLPKGIKRYEPRNALLAGADGLKYYRELLRQIKKNPALNQAVKFIILEIDPSQTAKIKALAKKHWPRAAAEIKKDLAGLNRAVAINLRKK